jgi:hypothetical protein
MDPSELPTFAPLTGCLRLAGIIAALIVGWLVVLGLVRLGGILF